jgi:protein-tyrosine phosphatase
MIFIHESDSSLVASRIASMIDIHNHILPGLDDGSKSWDTTLEMCHLAVEDGIKHIVATPHANEEYAYDRDRVRQTILELNDRVGNQLTFSIGCDFHLSYDNIEDAVAHPGRYTIGATPYLLVEFSDFGIPPKIADSFFRLQSACMIPIITHPERNAILQRHYDQILEWVEMGCLVQVTASSVLGFWGEAARKTSLRLIERNLVHVLATDAHDGKVRKPILSEARDYVAKRFGQDLARALVEGNPEAIVTARPVA